MQLDETAGSIQSGENAGTKAESETSGAGEVSLRYDAFADTIPDIREELEQKGAESRHVRRRHFPASRV